MAGRLRPRSATNPSITSTCTRYIFAARPRAYSGLRYSATVVTLILEEQGLLSHADLHYCTQFGAQAAYYSPDEVTTIALRFSSRSHTTLTGKDQGCSARDVCAGLVIRLSGWTQTYNGAPVGYE